VLHGKNTAPHISGKKMGRDNNSHKDVILSEQPPLFFIEDIPAAFYKKINVLLLKK